MLYCHDPIKPLQCPWPWNINWHQRFQEWMKKWISEETQKCIEHKQTIIIRMIIVERNVRSLIERCHPRDYLSRNTFWPRSVFHRLWRQNIISICSIRWRVLIKCPGRGPPSYQWEAWSWWPSITPWQLANKYYQQERGAGPGRGHGGQTIDHRAVCNVPSCIAPLNRVQ